MICPFCKFMFDPKQHPGVETSDGEIHKPYDCPKCGRQFVEVYRFEGLFDGDYPHEMVG
jgi:hypothetical protein